MSHLFLTKFASGGTVLSIAFVVILITASPSPAPPETTTINFESLPDAVQIVRNQFAEKGIIFQPVTGLDYSQGIPIPNFAHSGTKAIELCRALEFCKSKLDISFTTPQRRVKMWTGWTGFTSRLDSAQIVVMRAFDGNGNQVATDTRTLGPSTGVIPISTPLEVTVPSPMIVRVTAGFINAELPSGGMFNNDLAFDDIEFDDQGSPPQCPATQPPAFTVNEPTDGAIVVHNAFTLDANLSTPDPFSTLEVNVTGQSGGTRTFGPRFAASGHIQIFNISDLLFEGQNTLIFTVKDCAGTTQVTRTINFRRITRTSIRVIDESGANIQTARIYANESFIGLTDAAGMLFVTPPLREGTRLVARKLVAESSTYRDNHSQGSFQDWNFRVYTSSMGVDNNGSLTTNPVNYLPDPNAPQVLRIMRRNTLIGLHLVASIAWDASETEMETVKKNLIGTSKYLYNATDGQMFIEQAEVVDDAKYWEDADFHIWNQSIKPYVDSRVGGFLTDSILKGKSWIHVQIAHDASVLAHEFGHYGFGLRDEYQGAGISPQCTSLVTVMTTGNVFKMGEAKASCMMFDNEAPKLCSNRSENRHLKGTKQGDSSCWSTMLGHYRDSNSNPRWILQSPETRGAILGTINGGNLPLNDMALRVTFENAARLNLCQPITVLAKRSDGTPHSGRDIWLMTTYGQNIRQGKTDARGLLTVTGAHVGDRIEGRTVEFVNCAVRARPTPSQTQHQPAVNAIPVTFSQSVEQASQRLEIGPTPFNIVTALKPTKKGAQVTLAIEDSARQTVTLAKSPVVKFKIIGVHAQRIQMCYDAKTKSYSGTIAELSIDSEVEISVEAIDSKQQVVESVSIFRVSRLDPEGETDVISSDGQLTLTVPAKGLPAGARISIGSPSTTLPALPDGYAFISGPFAIWSYPANKLYHSATVSFQFQSDGQGSAFTGYATDSLRVFHYEGKKWADIGGVVRSHPIALVTFKTSRLGMFALVGKTVPKQYP